MKKFKLYGLSALGAAILMLSGCERNDFGQAWNWGIIGLGIVAGAVLLGFIVYAFISTFYKGKVVELKVIKKKETTVLRGNTIGRGTPGGGGGRADLSRRARRQKTRMRYSKVVVEIDGEQKTLRCNDIVLLDKLMVGKTNKVRVRFREIVKIVK
jgi:hypothetical protein